jgi:hypothetical protein
MSSEIVYTCDGCQKILKWSEGANKWTEINIWRRTEHPNETAHVCSEVCLRIYYSNASGKPFDAKVLQSEARAAERTPIQIDSEERKQLLRLEHEESQWIHDRARFEETIRLRETEIEKLRVVGKDELVAVISDALSFVRERR